MAAIPRFFCEDIGGVEDAWDVTDANILGLCTVPDSTVLQVNVFHAFGAGGLGPVRASLVVIEERGGKLGIR